jgi:hypothetical protein
VFGADLTPGSCSPLPIGIDEQDVIASRGPQGGEICRHGRLAGAPLFAPNEQDHARVLLQCRQALKIIRYVVNTKARRANVAPMAGRADAQR